MQISESPLLSLLDGNKQFILPIYQRRYSWKVNDCEQLLEDIIRVGNENWPSYFLGTIVFRHERTSPITQSIIIDGQQRLTTLSLLLYALGKSIEVNNAEIIAKRELINDYLFNRYNEGEGRYKLLLTKHDKDILSQLLDDKDVSQTDSLLVENYNFFKKELEHTNLKTVYEGIHKLMIVAIELNSPSEKSQVIFENLNSKGRELTQVDLIRNYVLMDQESSVQDKLYNNYWYPMEENFDKEYPGQFDAFIRHYLMLKTGECPQIKKVYESFKRFIPDEQHPETLEKKIGDIVRYSEYYLDIALLRETEENLRNCLKDILDLKLESVFPLLLGVYEGYKKAQIAEQEVSDIFRLIESYMFRRIVCGMKPISNQTVAELASKLEYKHGCFHILRQKFAEEHGTHRFPSDSEVKQHLPIKRFTESHSKYVNYLLGKLENYEREKEQVDAKQYTIEHIMPRKLTKGWIAELGDNYLDVHETLLHTIGNLTLTGHNTRLGNRPFKKKQTIQGGFRDSPLHLNRSLVEVEKWNKKAIENRAKRLTEKALDVWRNHGLGSPLTKPKYDYPHLKNEEMKQLFMELEYLITSLHTSVYSRPNQRYVSFSITQVFAAIEPQYGRLRLGLRIPHSELDDLLHRSTDTSSRGNSGMLLGSEVFVDPGDDIHYIMSLVNQAFSKQMAEI